MQLWMDQPFYYNGSTMEQVWSHVEPIWTTWGTSVVPRANTAAIVATATEGGVSRILGTDGGPAPSGSTFGLIVRYRFSALPSQDARLTILKIRTSTTDQISLTIKTDGRVEARRGGPTGTVLGTSTNSLAPNTWYHIGCTGILHASTGTVTVAVDTVTAGWLTLTGQNTANSGTAWDGIALGRGASGLSINQYWTDIWAFDGTDGTAATPAQHLAFNTLPGDVRVDYKLTAATGDYDEWSKSTGTDGEALVDDAAPDGDTTYIFSATSGQRQTFTLDDLPAGVTVVGVMPVYSCTKDDAGSQQVRPMYRISSTDYNGTAVQAPSSGTYGFRTELRAASPATGNAWGVSEFNGAQLGVNVP